MSLDPLPNNQVVWRLGNSNTADWLTLATQFGQIGLVKLQGLTTFLNILARPKFSDDLTYLKPRLRQHTAPDPLDGNACELSILQ